MSKKRHDGTEEAQEAQEGPEGVETGNEASKAPRGSQEAPRGSQEEVKPGDEAAPRLDPIKARAMRDRIAKERGEVSQEAPAEEGQPPQDDPNRTLSEGEVAANVAIATGPKGDTAPMHPANNLTTLTPPDRPRVGPDGSTPERYFTVVSGIVAGFRAAAPGQPAVTVSATELNLPEEALKRLMDRGVISENENV